MGWLTASETLALLRVRPQTLYSYVSRGRVLAKPSPDDPRCSLYSQPDVERLARSSRSVRRPSAVAASSIAWGEPILPSAISTVHAGRLVYRGRDAVQWSGTATLEDVAAVLWQASDPFAGPIKPLARAGGRDAAERAFATLALLAATGTTPLGRSVEDTALESATVLRALVAVCGRAQWRTGEPIHAYLARSWDAPEAAEPLRRALVLLADHELNVSTFAARVTASTGAPLPACVLSALCALSGPRHGGAAAAVQALVDRAEPPDDRASAPPGFGHPLYAGIDIRAATLLGSFEEPKGHARVRDLIANAHDLAPNIDYALSALATRFSLPADAPFLIFAIARSVGWLAHSLEQIRQGDLIRPRASYTGPLPDG